MYVCVTIHNALVVDAQPFEKKNRIVFHTGVYLICIASFCPRFDVLLTVHGVVLHRVASHLTGRSHLYQELLDLMMMVITTELLSDLCKQKNKTRNRELFLNSSRTPEVILN